MAKGTAESFARNMASPGSACLHTKQEMVVICTEQEIKETNYDVKFEQVSCIVCFTAMAGIETDGTSLKARLCD
jgi:hypothetical protein